MSFPLSSAEAWLSKCGQEEESFISTNYTFFSPPADILYDDDVDVLLYSVIATIIMHAALKYKFILFITDNVIIIIVTLVFFLVMGEIGD